MKKLGYNLSDKEISEAFERFKVLADKKKYVFDEDIDAILEDEIARIPETWQLQYLKVTSETGCKPSAEVRLKYRGENRSAHGEGDGPVDACYKAIESIVRSDARVTHYGIQSVTGGKDAQGEVVVKLEIDGREITGHGTSTDIIEASVKAYLFALNKVSARNLLVKENSKPSPV